MKLEITIPTDLSEIKLSQYQKFFKIAKDNEDSEFLHQKMVQIFCNIDLKDVANIKRKDVVNITNNLGTLFNANHKFIPKFKIAGLEFGFIPNLDDMTQGEYVDLDTYIVNWEDMHKAMAVLYRPIINKVGDRYQIEEYKGSITYADVMKHAPLNVVLGSMVFFYHLGNELLKSTLIYLEDKQTKMGLANKHNLENDGDGIAHSMLSLREMLEDLMKFQSLPYINV
jgi:hypothetical protein